MRALLVAFLVATILIAQVLEPGTSAHGLTELLSPTPDASKPHLNELRMDKLSGWILSFDIAQGSDLAAAATGDLRVRIWKVESGEVVHELAYHEPETDVRLKLENEVEPITVQFSPDGRLLAVSYLSRIHFYDTKSWIEILNLGVVGEDNLRTDMKVTPAAPQLERRSAEQAQRDKSAPVPDLNESMRAWAYAKEKGDGRTRITDFSFDLDGDHIVAAYCRGGCYASPGRRWSAFPTGSDPVRLWDIRGGRIVWEQVYDKEGVTTRIVPSPDKKQFAAVNSHLGQCATGVYDLADGRVQWSHSLGPCGSPPSIRFCRDGQSLITSRNDEGNRKNRAWRTVAIYAVKDGTKITDLPDSKGVSAMDITSNGRWLASTTWSEREFQIWDLEIHKVVSDQVPREYKWKGSRLLDLVHFSPDDRWLVVGSMTAGELVIYQTGLNP